MFSSFKVINHRDADLSETDLVTGFLPTISDNILTPYTANYSDCICNVRLRLSSIETIETKAGSRVKEQRRLLSDWLISSVFSLVNLLKVILRAGKNAKVRGSFGGVG